MKICYITDSANIHAQRWIKYFADKGHEIHIISLSYESKKTYEKKDLDYNLPISNINVYQLKRSPRALRFFFPPAAFFFDAIKAKELIKVIKPDIIHAHYVADQGVVASFLNYQPLVLSAWGSDILVAPKNSIISKLLIKFALNKSDIITCDGENLRDAIKALGVDNKKINLIYHGVNPTIFNPAARDLNLRAELRLASSLAVISTRHFFPLYGIKTLMRAAALVLKEFDDVVFILISNGPEKEELENMARSFGILDKIIFTGFLPWDQLPKYLASSDIYVSTSVSEGGIAVSTMEAMASSLPVVLTDVGDNYKWVDDGLNGFIIPINDSEELANRLIYLLNHEEIRRKMGDVNRKLIYEKFNYFNEMNKMEGIYKELIGRYTK